MSPKRLEAVSAAFMITLIAIAWSAMLYMAGMAILSWFR